MSNKRQSLPLVSQTSTSVIAEPQLSKRASVASSLSIESLSESPTTAQIVFVRSRPRPLISTTSSGPVSSSSRASLPSSPVLRPARSLQQSKRKSLPPPARNYGSTDDQELEKRASRRWNTAVELRDTERTFVHVLDSIDEDYYQPLSDANESILSKRDLAQVFPVFQDVRRVAKVMLETLEEAVQNVAVPTQPLALTIDSSLSSLASPPSSYEPSLCLSDDTLDSHGPTTPEPVPTPPPPSEQQRPTASKRKPSQRRREHARPLGLARALLPVLPFLKTYSFFVVNFSSALAKLGQLESESTAWNAFCDNVRRQRRQQQRTRLDSVGGSQGISLGGMLLTVVQRVPRYRLLLQDLIRFTEHDHPDLPHLFEAFRLVDQVASHYERHIADHTSALRSLELQKAFVDLKDRLVIPGRRLVREGAAHSNHHHQDARKLSLHLFTDVLVVGCNKASSIEKGLHVEAWMPVETLTVIKIQDAERLSLEVRSVQASFVLRFETTRERDAWMETIQTTTYDRLESKMSSCRRDSTRKARVPARPSLRTSFPFVSSSIDLLSPLLPTTPTASDTLVESPVSMTRAEHASSDTIADVPVAEGYNAPVWMADDESTRCQVCRELFGPLWRRRHHCRLCGCLVCADCSKRTFVIPATKRGEEGRTARACDTCFESCFGTLNEVQEETQENDGSSSTVMDRLARLLTSSGTA